MTRAIIVLIFWLASGFSAYAQSPVSVIGPVTSGNLPVFNSTTIIKDSGIPAGGFLPQHPISAAYQLTSADCGSLIVATGGTFYAVSQSGAYPVNCVVKILNNDPMPTGSNSTGAKFVNFVNCVPGEPGTYVWPQQTIDVVYVNSTWVPLHCPGLWEAPGGVFTINIDPTSGSDSWGGADGLSTTTRAFASVNNATTVFVTEMMQGNFAGATQFTFKLCSSCTDTAALHFPPHGSPVNGQGRAGNVLNCNGGTMSGSISLFFSAAILQVTNCTFTNTISLSEGAELVIDAGNTVTPVAGNFIFNLDDGAKLFNAGQTLNVAGGTGGGLIAMSTSTASFPAVNQTGNITWSNGNANVGVLIQASGYLAPFGTWTTNGFSLTGKSYSLIECGIIEGATNVPGTTGSVSCAQAN